MNRRYPWIVCGLWCLLATAAEPLAELREHLRQPFASPADRGRTLADSIGRPYSLLELSETLLLAEWRDNDPDDDLARIDRNARDALFRRFEEAVQEVCVTGSVAEKIAVANLVGNVGMRMTDAESCRRLGKSLGRPLTALFAERDASASEAACRALTAIYPAPETFLPAMQAEIQNGEPRRRSAAIAACVERCRLTALRSRPNSHGRGLPFQRLDILESTRDVIPILTQGLSDSNLQVRGAGINGIPVVVRIVADALCQAEDTALQPLSKPEQTALAGVRASLAAAVPVLVRSSAETEERIVMIQAVDEVSRIDLRIGACVPPDDAHLHDALVASLLPVAEQLEHRDARVRIAACHFLEGLGAAAAPCAGRLEPALRDPDCFVRWSAARALGKMDAPPESAVLALASRLQDPDANVRVASAAALAQLGNAAHAAGPALIAAADPANSLELRVAALRALERTGAAQQPAAQAVLSRALTDSNPAVRELAVAQLERAARAGAAQGVLLQPRSTYENDCRALSPSKALGASEAHLIGTPPSRP